MYIRSAFENIVSFRKSQEKLFGLKSSRHTLGQGYTAALLPS